MKKTDALRFLLLQVRNPGDPMAQHEHECFARALGCSTDQIIVHDLLHGIPALEPLDQVDMVLLGGSGDYSVAAGGEGLEGALEMMRELYARAKPTFASCWGFQAMARAMGGEVVTNLEMAEVGTHWLTLTAEGTKDPVFGSMGERFSAQMGHQDMVVSLPDDAVLLASSERVPNQAFRFRDKPIYCTQFHPELTRDGLVARVRNYPEYVQRITGLRLSEFIETTRETPEAEGILRRILELFSS